MTTTANEIIKRVRRLSPAQARQLRHRLDAMAQERKRQETQAAVRDYLARQRNGQRDQEIEEETIEAPAAQHQDRGGQRKAEAWYRGQPIYREDGEE